MLAKKIKCLFFTKTAVPTAEELKTVEKIKVTNVQVLIRNAEFASAVETNAECVYGEVPEFYKGILPTYEEFYTANQVSEDELPKTVVFTQKSDEK